ncbi:beta-ketoacyl synthase N-terminal-like domain-containing protein [Streptomyces sp. NPDC004542]|uniref:beta-ketoacyl synthase N-terminal-like domain-containing protein n=1 Tax=Streptomyces sp. NPDC004542 TaxID=3154281 RepID=UPI0033A937FB
MDNREILTRFKNGSLDRQSAVALLTGGPPAPAEPGPPAVDAPAVDAPAVDAAAVDAAVGAGAPAAAGTPPAVDAPPKSAAAAPQPVVEDRGGPPGVRDGIAVIGIAGRYPQAPDLETFWQNMLDGRDTAAAPAGREAPGAEDRGHFLEHVDQFDAAFFRLTDREAALTDPQERLFLHTAWQTLESAGCTGARLDTLISRDGRPRSLGVYVAAGSRDYLLLAAGQWAPGRGALPADGHWSLPNRLSALLDLSGPSQCVDTGESSFLVALHQALGALRAGECAAALVAGVDLRLHPARQVPGGGEGVGAVLLKPLAAATGDGDTVHAVVRSSAVAHLGRSGYGDLGGGVHDGAVELPVAEDGTACDDHDRGVDGGAAGPSAAEGGTLCETARTARGSVGAAGTATAAAALTRAVLQLRHGTVVAGRDGDGRWERPRRADGAELPRRARVVVRGSGGTEARAILEEYLPATAPEADRVRGAVAEEDNGEPQLVLLSAPTPDHLVDTARRLAHWLTARGRPSGPESDLTALARELRSGRAAHDCRLAVTAPSAAQLVTALDDFVHDPRAAADRARQPGPVRGLARTGDTRPGRDRPPLPPLLDDLPETRDYLTALWHGHRFEQLTRLWLAGVDVTRAAIPAGPVVPLPTSALRPRSLWLAGDGTAGPDPAAERTR